MKKGQFQALYLIHIKRATGYYTSLPVLILALQKSLLIAEELIFSFVTDTECLQECFSLNIKSIYVVKNNIVKI